jgi:nicotinamidase-related amidase
MTSLLHAAQCQLLMVDLQEKLLPAVLDQASLVKHLAVLAGAAQRLGVPVTVSEHCPSLLGSTCEAVRGHVPAQARVFSKTRFSCWGEDALRVHLTEMRISLRHQLIICGVEAHVCVLQTALDAQQAGCEVSVVVDAVSSRKALDLDTALSRMAAAGVRLVTTEMVVFEWLGRADTADFKALAPLIKALGAGGA